MRMWEPVKESSQPWICPYQDLLWQICSHGYASSNCGYAPARIRSYGYAPSNYGYAPARICSHGYAPSNCGYAPARICSSGYAPSNYGYAPARICSPGYAPMDTLLPTMDMPLPGGYSVMDMFLSTVDMLPPATNMLLSTTVGKPCDWGICQSHLSPISTQPAIQ